MTFRLSRRALTLTLTVALTFAADQLSKYWLLYGVGMIDRPPIVVTDFFSLVMLWNHGVSFGLLSRAGSAWAPRLLIGMAVVISGVLVRLALKSASRWERLGYGMVIGGALANALDRVRVGAVADFFYFHLGALGWPAFNIADSAICVGVCILLISTLRPSKVRV